MGKEQNLHSLGTNHCCSIFVTTGYQAKTIYELGLLALQQMAVSAASIIQSTSKLHAYFTVQG